MLRSAIHSLNQGVLIYRLWICLKSTSPSAAGAQWAWEPLFRAVDFSGQLEPKSLGCQTFLFPSQWTAYAVPWERGGHGRARVLSGAWLLKKIQTSGPFCHVPAAHRESSYMRAEARQPAEEGRHSHHQLPCPLLSGRTLKRNPRQPSSCRERDGSSLRVHHSSSQLVSYGAWGQKVYNSLVYINELTSQHHQGGRATED